MPVVFLSWLFPPFCLNVWSIDVGCFTLSLLLHDKGLVGFQLDLCCEMLVNVCVCCSGNSWHCRWIPEWCCCCCSIKILSYLLVPFRALFFWYSSLKKHFYGCKWDDIMLWRCGKHKMVLPNVMCEWGGGVKITYGVVVSDVWGLLLLGPFPVYTNKEEMQKCGNLLWGFILFKRSSTAAQNLGGFSAHLESTLSLNWDFLPCTTYLYLPDYKDALYFHSPLDLWCFTDWGNRNANFRLISDIKLSRIQISGEKLAKR